MRIKNKTAEEVAESVEKEAVEDKKDIILFSTGDTTLNLACSDTTIGAFPPGALVNIIGDSHAGKTFLAHSIMAEASINSEFEHYKLIYDRANEAPADGIARMFGNALTKMQEPEAGCSTNIQDFKINVWKILRQDEPFIYVLDSLDSLTSKEEEKQLDAAVAGKEEKGSYGMEKPKVLSKILGPICKKLEHTNSLLIILSQTRDNINPMSFQEKTRSGGKALKFYSYFEMWLALVGKHKKTAGDFDREIGHKTKIKVTKNKLTGKVRDTIINIFYDYGIDDVGTCVDFMVDGKFWETRKNTILATELGIEATRDKLIRTIEEKELEPRLRKVVGMAWRKIEDSIKLNRKAKYQ